LSDEAALRLTRKSDDNAMASRPVHDELRVRLAGGARAAARSPGRRLVGRGASWPALSDCSRARVR